MVEYVIDITIFIKDRRMGDVIDGVTRFEIKAALDTATTNLDTILDAVTSTQFLELGDSKAAIDFTARFLSGQIESFPEPLEDSDALYDQMGNKDRYGQVMKTIFAYQSNSGLTIALSSMFPDAPLMKVMSGGHLLMSGLWNVDKSSLLDVNGVHERQTLLDHWTRISHGAVVSIEPTTADELSIFTTFDSQDMLTAIENFGVVTKFMDEFLPSLTGEQASCSMDDDDLDDDAFTL
jgi:hypothetical protein